ncbi:transposase [Blautia schinkii]|nr:transposase [Blautia schinkii]
MSTKQGYSITTRRLRLRCRHPEWLQKTQDFYNEIAFFYYELLLKHTELWNLGSQRLLRELEILSLPGRENRIPESPLPWEKVPLYFRRAAANTGIAAAKSYLARQDINPGRKSQKLDAAVVFYKGMYRDFSSSEITLKVWDGNQWQWMRCRIYGQEFPEGAQIMSPSVVFEYKFVMLHVPIKEAVDDSAGIKQRFAEKRNFCSIQFTNGDAFAVGCISDISGSELAVRLWGGGKEYAHHCKRVVEKIEKSEKSLGESKCGRGRDERLKSNERPNQKYWMHLKHLAEHYAHEVSAGIVSFCKEHDAAVIVLPKYDKDYTRHVMYGSGDWSPLHLSVRIRQFLPYKAWKAGILVIDVNARGISSVCAKCGKNIVGFNKQKIEYFCEDGHRGNRHLNAARNLGKKYLMQFGKHVE